LFDLLFLAPSIFKNTECLFLFIFWITRGQISKKRDNFRLINRNVEIPLESSNINKLILAGQCP